MLFLYRLASIRGSCLANGNCGSGECIRRTTEFCLREQANIKRKQSLAGMVHQMT